MVKWWIIRFQHYFFACLEIGDPSGREWMINHHIFGHPIYSCTAIQPSKWVRFSRILRHGSRSLFLKIHHHGSENLESIQCSSVESCRVVFLWVSKLSSGKIEHDHHFPRGGRQCEDSSLDCIALIICDGLKYVTPYLDRCNWRSNLLVVMMIDDWSWWQVCWWSMTIFLNPPQWKANISVLLHFPQGSGHHFGGETRWQHGYRQEMARETRPLLSSGGLWTLYSWPVPWQSPST